ncbi:hypothetical protein HHK36_008980 [Tetracentron sinense]|uniref:Magnesium transporter n=1 Tax=Tetracentron sinense TaxID=13715 RepID=A0A834ZEH1_TETSI|nr:hypothetical protein HHK36_008980 [Tetracentron sinense]
MKKKVQSSRRNVQEERENEMRDPKPSTDEEVGRTAVVPPQTRRKGSGIRAWLIVSESGKSHLEEVGKHSIMRRTGLPARDLRILDPLLSYPSSILGRERAIVINLEHIKAIITAKEVLVLNSKNPLVIPFVQDLQFRVSSSNGAPQRETESSDAELNDSWVSLSFHDPHGLTRSLSTPFNISSDISWPIAEMNGSSPKITMDAPLAAGPKLLPFEFKALEACLESACRCLDSETSTLEQEAYPALDELTSKISTLNLERVRQIKSRLVAMSGRVQKVRDELEHLLDDDNDMAEMYLTDKLIHHPLDQTSLRDELDNDAFEVDDERMEEAKTEASTESLSAFKPNIEELEMLLEAYFAQIDGTLQKLSTVVSSSFLFMFISSSTQIPILWLISLSCFLALTLTTWECLPCGAKMREYVDDTEDYINIMLDDKQNQLLQMGVMLSTATLVFNAGIVVVGLFGMNIHISLFDGHPIQFWETTFGTIGGCLVLYFIAVGWGKTKGLLG